MTESRVTEDRFLGALLGMAIGDAVGSRALSPDRPVDEEDERNQYQISAVSEICLAIVESLTTNDGLIDVDNIIARIGFIAASASRERLSEATLAGLAWTQEHDRILDEGGDAAMSLEAASRGIPLGLLHAVGPFDAASLADDASQVTRITHSGTAVTSGTAAVATLLCGATRRAGDLGEWLGPVPREGELLRAIARAVQIAKSFEDALGAIAGDGIERSAHGAILGATAGAWFGVADIPQAYIDALDARIYLTLAAPWFYRTALRRQGTVIDLRKA